MSDDRTTRTSDEGTAPGTGAPRPGRDPMQPGEPAADGRQEGSERDRSRDRADARLPADPESPGAGLLRAESGDEGAIPEPNEPA